jgi:hypothetical protein
MKKTSLLMAAVIAATTVIAAGLTVLPSSVQHAQAQIGTTHCQNNEQNAGASGNAINEIHCDLENVGSIDN